MTRRKSRDQLAMIQPTHEPERVVCLSQHPADSSVKCRRLAGHSGDHSAFTYSVRTPTLWSQSHDERNSQ